MWNKKRMLVGILGIILVLNGCSYLPKSNKDLSSVGQHKIVEEESQREEQDIEEMVHDRTTADEDSCGGEHHYIDINGITLYYSIIGEGKPLILVHPNSGDHTAFETLIPKLVKAGYQIYAVDSRGQGKSSVCDEYHYEDMMEDMYCFIKAKRLDKPAYYGWSDGGIIGLLLELKHPGTLSVMAISGANLFPEGLNMEDETVLWVKSMVEKEHDPLLELLFKEPKISPESLQNIDIPVLVTAGSEDMILTEHTELIADNLAKSTLMIMDGYDHWSYIVNTDNSPDPKWDKTIMAETLIDYLQQNHY